MKKTPLLLTKLTTLLFALCLSTTAHAELVLHYTFEEGEGSLTTSAINPSAGNTLLLDRVGTDTTWTDGPTGHGRAIEIISNTGQIRAKDPNSWNPVNWKNGTPTTQLTLACWVKKNKVVGRAFPSIIGALSKNNLQFYQIRGGNTIFSHVKSKADIKTPTVKIPYHQWTHLTMTFDPAQQIVKFYVNGKLRQTSKPTNSSFSGWHQGAFQFAGLGYADRRFQMLATYDDLRIYDEVLSESQINTIIGNTGNIVTKLEPTKTNATPDSPKKNTPQALISIGGVSLIFDTQQPK